MLPLPPFLWELGSFLSRLWSADDWVAPWTSELFDIVRRITFARCQVRGDETNGKDAANNAIHHAHVFHTPFP